jgi:hypothetical protein
MRQLPMYLKIGLRLGNAYNKTAKFTVRKVAEAKVLKDKYQNQKGVFSYE